MCNDDARKWYSFEPIVEFKFSNFHAANQVQDNGRLVCSFGEQDNRGIKIVPINRELLDIGGIQYNDIYYCQDYFNSHNETVDVPGRRMEIKLDD